jgi:hypothetical protein
MRIVLAIPIDLEYHLGLIEKQLKRVAQLADVAPYGPTKMQLADLVRRLELEAACLRHGLETHFAKYIDKGGTGSVTEQKYEGGP